MPNPLTNRVLGFLSKLSFPRLFLISAALFVLDPAIPDFDSLRRRNPARPGHAAAREHPQAQGNPDVDRTPRR